MIKLKLVRPSYHNISLILAEIFRLISNKFRKKKHSPFLVKLPIRLLTTMIKTVVKMTSYLNKVEKIKEEKHSLRPKSETEPQLVKNK